MSGVVAVAQGIIQPLVKTVEQVVQAAAAVLAILALAVLEGQAKVMLVAMRVLAIRMAVVVAVALVQSVKTRVV